MMAAGGTLGPSRNFKSIEEMVGNLIFLATADNQPPAEKTPGEKAPADKPAERP
jgi:phospholipid/cholesterol/gamma-HCH transport system substrate-binding protein